MYLFTLSRRTMMILVAIVVVIVFVRKRQRIMNAFMPKSTKNTDAHKSITNTAKAAKNAPKSTENVTKSNGNKPKSIVNQNVPKSGENTQKSANNALKTVDRESIGESQDCTPSQTGEIGINDMRKKSTHNVFASKCVINEYGGNNDIRRLRKLYMKRHKKTNEPMPNAIPHGKSRHTVKRSMEIIANHKDMELLKLKKKYKRKQKQKTNYDDDKEEDKENDDEELILKPHGHKSAHSVRRSSIIINEYRGNDDIWILKKKYMEQYERTSVAKKQAIPAKPHNIEEFMNEYTNGLHGELREYLCAHTHYVGMAEFEDNEEMCVEIMFTSNSNTDGTGGDIRGSRVVIGDRRGVTEGKAKIYKDVIWNSGSNAYEGCIRFEWMDVCRDVVTRLVFNTNNNYFDMRHLYFEGQCYQYRKGLFADDAYDAYDAMDVNSMDVNSKQVRKGVFNMVCVSMRKRDICKRDGLLQYHEVDIWSMNDEQLQRVPKHIKCMNITSVKMRQTYDANARY